MEQTHIKSWFKLYPDLRFMLSKEDREVLDKLDPADYIDYNITSEAEVIKIIHRNRRYGWVWIRRFPELKNLPADEQVILDHIYPGEFIGDLTEKDIRRIVAYRKSNKAKEEDDEKRGKAHEYYKEHETEIRKEVKTRDKLTYISKVGIIVGTALTSAGFLAHSLPCIISGISLILIPNLLSIRKLQDLNKHTVIPAQETQPEEISKTEKHIIVAMVVSYYVWLLGISATVGAFITGVITDWEAGTLPITVTGITAIIGLIAFLVLAIVTPSKK